MNVCKKKSQDNIFSICSGIVIRRIRKEIGITAHDLAKRLNISQQQMSRYERGINKLTIDMIFNISLALECPFERIIRFVIYEVQRSPSDDVISLRNKISASDITYYY